MADNMCFDWDDLIADDGAEFVLLPEGDYTFTVKGFERARFPGSAKIPACNKAVMSLEFSSSSGKATVKTDLILYKSLEWKLASFFRCIGMKKHGEPLKMDFQGAVGKTGKAHVKIREYQSNGETRKTNDVEKFIDPDEAAGGEFEI